MLVIKKYGEISTETLTKGQYTIYTFITITENTDLKELKEYLIKERYITDECIIKGTKKTIKIKGPHINGTTERRVICEIPFGRYLRLAPYDASKTPEELMESVVLE